MLEIAYGNVTQEEADRLEQAAGTVDDVAHIPGSAEPWVSRLVHSFIIATGARTVLETGCFMGGTSVWILDALNRLGGGVLFLSEIEKDRLHSTVARIAPLMGEHIGVVPHHGDVLDFLGNCKTRFDLVWLDDNHEKPHVFKELQLLLPKMNEGGIILGHDVWGSCDLQEVFRKFGGYSLELPRLGAAGGIGIIQVPHLTSRAVF
jgi:predicted O-methyltransferase YrrM